MPSSANGAACRASKPQEAPKRECMCQAASATLTTNHPDVVGAKPERPSRRRASSDTDRILRIIGLRERERAAAGGTGQESGDETQVGVESLGQPRGLRPGSTLPPSFEADEVVSIVAERLRRGESAMGLDGFDAAHR